jgi:hypothetical protein
MTACPRSSRAAITLRKFGDTTESASTNTVAAGVVSAASRRASSQLSA